MYVRYMYTNTHTHIHTHTHMYMLYIYTLYADMLYIYTWYADVYLVQQRWGSGLVSAALALLYWGLARAAAQFSSGTLTV